MHPDLVELALPEAVKSPFSLILFLKLTSFTGLCLKDVWQHHSSQYQLIQRSLLQLHEAKVSDEEIMNHIIFKILGCCFYFPIVVLSGLLKEVMTII